MEFKKRRNMDRRLEPSQRKIYHMNYFLDGGIERRSNKERRGLGERRVGWVKTDDWKSVYLGNLTSSDDLRNLDHMNYYPLITATESFTASIDKRKFNRFPLQDYGFAIFRPSSKIVGQIRDVSRGGLSFRYANIHKNQLTSSQLDIFILSSGFYIDKMPFRMVSERNVDIELPDNSTSMNQCGVAFDGLTHIQENQLDYLIKTYTIAECVTV